MPELPEVETLRRSLEPLVVGRRVTRVKLRCGALRRTIGAPFVSALTDRRVIAARRRAKYLLFDLDDGRSWIIHLGMSGRLLHHAGGGYELKPHDHVVAELDDASILVFHDPRRFGLLAVEDASTSLLLNEIGPEPLDPEIFDAAYLRAVGRGTRRTVKDTLMDQRVVGGLGNIYVNEILFVAGIRPRRRLARATQTECERIVVATREILGEAIEHRGSSISDFLDGIGRRGAYQWRRRVYDRAGAPCVRCRTPIKAVIIGQRSSFYCPSCQR